MEVEVELEGARQRWRERGGGGVGVPEREREIGWLNGSNGRPGIPLMALTATVTIPVREDVVSI
jgi:hypothetical protein